MDIFSNMVIDSIHSFRYSKQNLVNSVASTGWQFALNFDHHFFSNDRSSKDLLLSNRQVNYHDARNIQTKNVSNKKKACVSINEIGRIASINDRYKRLLEVANSDSSIILKDTILSDNPSDSIFTHLENRKLAKLNVIVIGGGVVGLFFSSLLKNLLGEDVNIIVADNRSTYEGFRKPFDRNWLTSIRSSEVMKNAPPNLQQLLTCFGENGFVGVPIRILETIFMLSCKEQGVDFYFSPKIQIASLVHQKVDFYIDATGSRLKTDEYFMNNDCEIIVPNDLKDFSFAGIRRPSIIWGKESTHYKYLLKSNGFYHFPTYKNTYFNYKMIKITGISSLQHQEIYDFVNSRNKKNRFYIWLGNLKPELNQILVFVNLKRTEAKFFDTVVTRPSALRKFFYEYKYPLKNISQEIFDFINLLAERGPKSRFLIEPSFSYEPYLHCSGKLRTINSKPVFPIGDSIFSGHPKEGNGLSFHIHYVNALIENIKNVN